MASLSLSAGRFHGVQGQLDLLDQVVIECAFVQQELGVDRNLWMELEPQPTRLELHLDDQAAPCGAGRGS